MLWARIQLPTGSIAIESGPSTIAARIWLFPNRFGFSSIFTPDLVNRSSGVRVCEADGDVVNRVAARAYEHRRALVRIDDEIDFADPHASRGRVDYAERLARRGERNFAAAVALNRGYVQRIVIKKAITVRESLRHQQQTGIGSFRDSCV